MTYRTILTLLEGGEVDRSELHAAGLIAGRFGSHVDALFVRRDARASFPMVGEGMSAEVVERIMASVEQENDAHAAAARRAFDTWREGAGVPLADTPAAERKATARWIEETGRAAEIMARRGKLAELIVIKSPSIGETGAFDPMVEAALFDTGRPVLMAPTPQPKTIATSISIFWNDSPEASRAVLGALPLIGGAEKVEVLCVDEGSFDAASAERLAASLGWYGCRAEARTLRPKGRSAGEAMLEAAAEADADLVVMGAFSHSRLRQMVFGGVTRHMLEVVARPVLMAH